MAGPLGLLLFEMEVARERYTRDAYTETMIEITVYKIILHNAPDQEFIRILQNRQMHHREKEKRLAYLVRLRTMLRCLVFGFRRFLHKKGSQGVARG